MNPTILKLIEDERKRQDEQWGGPEHDDTHDKADWVNFMDYQTWKLDFDRGTQQEAFVAIAALAVAALESLQRKEGLSVN